MCILPAQELGNQQRGKSSIDRRFQWVYIYASRLTTHHALDQFRIVIRNSMQDRNPCFMIRSDRGFGFKYQKVNNEFSRSQQATLLER